MSIVRNLPGEISILTDMAVPDEQKKWIMLNFAEITVLEPAWVPLGRFLGLGTGFQHRGARTDHRKRS